MSWKKEYSKAVLMFVVQHGIVLGDEEITG